MNPTEPPRVLVVEDDPHFRDAMRVALTSMGVDPIVVGDGHEALAWLARGERPSLILLDLNMPGMDGWAFRAAQRADIRFASIPVILMTARGDATNQGHRLHVAGAVQKPVDLDHLRMVLATHLSLS